VGKGERGQRVVTNKARRAAFAASPGRDAEIAKAIPKAIPAKAGWRGELGRG